MTEKQALETIKKDLDKSEAMGNGLVTTTIGALRKLYQMADKQMQKKGIKNTKSFLLGYECPTCNFVNFFHGHYCPCCGQKLDWSVTDK